MPTHDFTCTDCNHTFEHTRPFGSTEVPGCPKCEGGSVTKQIAKPSIVFKGEGFYVNDSQPTAKEETPAEPVKPSLEAKKPEPKPEPKKAVVNQE